MLENIIDILQSLYVELKGTNILSTLVRLLLAVLFGGMIGMERGRRRRAAGLRTHILVCMGAALVMITNQYINLEYSLGDPSRMGAQVISGIGFLGVGTIIVDRQQQVRGLTTAAGLWACACMGLALGVGFYSGAIIACLLILSTIVILNKLEYRIISASRKMEIYAEFENHGGINCFLQTVAQSSIKVEHLEIIQPRDYKGKEDCRAAAIIVMRLPKKYLHGRVIESLDAIPGLLIIEELH